MSTSKDLKNEQIPALSLIPPPTIGDSLRSLARVSTPQPYAVFAYCLNSDIPAGPSENFDPQKDPLVVIIPLGGYPTWEAAEDKARAVTKALGYRGIVAASCGRPIPLSMSPETVKVSVYDSKEAQELSEKILNARDRKEVTAYEEKLRQQKEILREQEASYKEGTLEYFKSAVCLASSHQMKLRKLREKTAELESAYDRRLRQVAVCLDKEEELMAHLKSKNFSESERAFYGEIIASYPGIKSEAVALSLALK